MMRKAALTGLTTLLLAPTLALASPAPPAEGSLEERLHALERQQVEIYHTLEEKKAAGLASAITDRITISGLLEVEASLEETRGTDGKTSAGSDLVLATAQLGFGVTLSENIGGDLIFLFEEDDTDPPEVDEATINLAFGPWSGRLGRQYLPFGVYHSHFVSDPLTLELGETQETALLARFQHGPLTLAAFVFNGDAEKEGREDHLRDWGGSLVFTPAEGIELGGSYLSDLADTDAGIFEPFADGDAAYRHTVAGWSAFAAAEVGSFGLAGEILGAAGRFSADDLDLDFGTGNGRGDKPLAWNLELAFYPAPRWELAARYEGSQEILGFPERQYGLDLSFSPLEYVTLSLEALRGDFSERFGDGLDRRDLVTAQLALEF